MADEGELEGFETETDFSPSVILELDNEWVAWLRSTDPGMSIGGYDASIDDLGDQNVA